MKITQAILPVAGYGTRFLPWTKVVPKELLPIGTAPIIAHLVDECLSVGVSDICFVISKGKEAIPQYFYEHPELEHELKLRGKSHMLAELKRYDEVNFHVVYQDDMKGDGHAILQAKDWVKSDEVAILFGDDLIIGEKTGLQQLADAYDDLIPGSALLCLQKVPSTSVSKYGIVDIADDKHVFGKVKRVKGLVEKPAPEDAPSDLGIVGKYIIPRSTFLALDAIEHGSKDGEVRLIDGLIAQLKDIEIHGCVFEGTRYDTGTPVSYTHLTLPTNREV